MNFSEVPVSLEKCGPEVYPVAPRTLPKESL